MDALDKILRRYWTKTQIEEGELREAIMRQLALLGPQGLSRSLRVDLGCSYELCNRIRVAAEKTLKSYEETLP
jgi:hypothetical protein